MQDERLCLPRFHPRSPVVGRAHGRANGRQPGRFAGRSRVVVGQAHDVGLPANGPHSLETIPCCRVPLDALLLAQIVVDGKKRSPCAQPRGV